MIDQEMFHLDPQTPGYGLSPLVVAPLAESRWRTLSPRRRSTGTWTTCSASSRRTAAGRSPGTRRATASRLEWRGIVTLAALRTLTSYGRLNVPDPRDDARRPERRHHHSAYRSTTSTRSTRPGSRPGLRVYQAPPNGRARSRREQVHGPRRGWRPARHDGGGASGVAAARHRRPATDGIGAGSRSRPGRCARACGALGDQHAELEFGEAHHADRRLTRDGRDVLGDQDAGVENAATSSVPADRPRTRRARWRSAAQSGRSAGRRSRRRRHAATCRIGRSSSGGRRRPGSSASPDSARRTRSLAPASPAPDLVHGIDGSTVLPSAVRPARWPTRASRPAGPATAASWSATGPGPVEPGVVRAASADRTDSTSRTDGSRCSLTVVRSSSVTSSSSHSRADAQRHQPAGDLVRVAERHALADQPVGDLGGQRVADRRGGDQPVHPYRHRGDHAGQRRQHAARSVSTASKTGSLSSCMSRS